jgi:hypothetical protein
MIVTEKWNGPASPILNPDTILKGFGFQIAGLKLAVQEA